MKRRLVLFAAIAVAGLPAGTGAASAQVSAPLFAAKTCSSSYTKGTIGGVQKCLRRGEYCAVRYTSTYPRYGFRCYGSPARLH
jgi:hypothetical protein